jgi:5-methyltetrahydropteroyltriglutamate--homocysteine methyltransferase
MSGGAPRRPARAEVVGSLLRPPPLREAVAAFYAPGHSAVLDEERAQDRTQLTELENRAIREVVGRQIDCGLDVVSDGEFRRWMFMNSFYDAVEGFRTDNDQGRPVELAVHEIVDRLRPVDSPAAREAAFVASITRHPFKVTFPAASIFGHPFTFKRGLTDKGYADLPEFVAHAIEIERHLVADAIAAGAGYIQFDFPLYPYLVDPAWVGRFRERGHDPAALLDAALAADAAVLQGIPPHVTTGLHICRGNYRSSWMCEGSLEPVAEAVFAGLPYDTFLVEWDDLGRDGGFAPLRHLRPGSVMVMGLISSKVRDLESEDDLMRQMARAAAMVGGIDRLAISPQCGFASVMVGNETDTDAQWRKLELVGQVADRLWPR